MANFVMPSLGADMESGTLIEWTVKPGEKVTRGQTIAVVGTEKGEMRADAGKVDIDKAVVRREGTDLSILTYGSSLFRVLDAAETLAMAGIEAEVVDLRTLRPLDDETIMQSVAKTHRVLIVDEGWRSGGISAEISARIMEQAFYELDQPVDRLCGAEVPMPYPKHLEEVAMPLAPDVVAAVQRMMNYG